MNHLFQKLSPTSCSKACGVTVCWSVPPKSASWIRLPWLSDTDNHYFSLVVQIAWPPKSASGIRLPWLSDTDPDPWSCSTMVESKHKSALVGNRWRTPPGSSDTDPDPWSRLQAPLDPIALPGTCPSTTQTEGVTKGLDPVRKRLDESSSQFRQGLTCFLININSNLACKLVQSCRVKDLSNQIGSSCWFKNTSTWQACASL